jgi:hypothetical protein
MEHKKHYIHYNISNRTGGTIVLKNTKVIHGDFYQIYNGDNKEWRDVIKIKNNHSFDLYFYGGVPISDDVKRILIMHNKKVPVSMGTKGSFDIFTSYDEKICHLGWCCSDRQSLNEFGIYYSNKDFIIQHLGGNQINGAIGNVSLVIARLPLSLPCNIL